MLAAAARITSIPILMALRDNILAFSQPGALPAAYLEQVINGIRALDIDNLLTAAAESRAGHSQAISATS